MNTQEAADFLDRNPRSMTKEEKAAWKRQLARILTGQEEDPRDKNRMTKEEKAEWKGQHVRELIGENDQNPGSRNRG